MEIIDERGRLFNRINVIDALVVLLAISLAVAGASLLLGADDPDTDPEPATRYATVSYATPIESPAALLETGDSLATTDGSTSYEVVDVYRSFRPNGDAYVVGRLAYNGTFAPGGDELLGGDDVSLATTSYRISGRVVAVNQSSRTIPTRRTSLVLAVNASESVVRTLEPGQRARIGNDTVATVESIDRNDGSNRTLVGLEVRVWDRAVGPAYDGGLVRVGNPLTVVTDRAVLRGTVHRIGTTETGDA